MKFPVPVQLGVCCLVMYCSSVARGQTYTVTDLGALPGDVSSQAYFVNSAGVVTGCSDNVLSQNDECAALAASDAFLWTSKSGMQDLGNLPGNNASVGFYVNDLNQVAGFSEDTGSGYYYGFVWSLSTGMMELPPLPGGITSLADVITNSGIVLGQSTVTNGDIHAVVWRLVAGKYQPTDLGVMPGTLYTEPYDINAKLQIVGAAYPSNDTYEAFLFSKAMGYKKLAILPGGENSIADWINDAGIAVGMVTTTTNPNGIAVLWDATGAVHSLGTLPGGTQSYGGGINDVGQIVGESTIPGGASHAVIWQTGGLLDLNDLIPAGSGWVLNHASSISETGQISGYGTVNAATHGFLLTPAQ